MLSLFRLLFPPKITTPQEEQTLEERRIIKWVNKMIPRAKYCLDAYYGNVLLDDLIFLHRTSSHQLELWLTSDRSGRSCLDHDPSNSKFISSTPIADWNRAWIIILGCLNSITQNPKHKFHNRIRIESTPECPLHEIHHIVASHIILWYIRPSGNLIANLPSEPRVNRDAPIFHCGDLPDFREWTDKR